MLKKSEFFNMKLSDATAHAGDECSQTWERLDADADGVESVRSVCATLQLVFLCLCQLLTSLVLLALVDAGTHDADEKVFVVVFVEQNLMTGPAYEHAVDEHVLLDVVHWVADVNVVNQPAVASRNSAWRSYCR